MKRDPAVSRSLVLTLAAIGLLGPGSVIRAGPQHTLARIAFGSCARQNEPQPIWEKIAALKPQLFLFIGDNIYGDTEDMEVLRRKYAELGAQPGFRLLRRSCPVWATWDDHDYGINDGGVEYPKKVESQRIFLQFFEEPKDSPRWRREGVYDARLFGPPGRQVQVILLDTRYFRSPLKKKSRPVQGQGPYEPNEDPSTTMLGPAQWSWLGEQLRVPARVRILASSVQVVPEDHGWEKWMNFPHERQRLFQLIGETGRAHTAGRAHAEGGSGVVFISGDRHLAELSMMDGGVGYPLYDLTASGMNAGNKRWRAYEPNRHRVGTMNWGDNFGMIEIDWDRPDPVVRLQIRDADGEINIQRKIPLSTLQPGVIR